MNGWQFTAQPPAQWAPSCADSGALFHSPLWLELLHRGLGAEPLFGWHTPSHARLPLSVFCIGPFRVAYAGFPCAGLWGSTAALKDLPKARFERRVDLLRANLPGLEATALALPSLTSTPETVIENLQGWRLADLPKLERDLKKAARSPLLVQQGQGSTSGADWHQLYLQTVERHHGQVRYPARWFETLLGLLPQPRLAAWHALHEGTLAGFCIAALDGNTGYYLHGAVAPDCRSLGVTDRLLWLALQWAQAGGARRFSLMSSPPAQAGLIRYKEKWGGITRPLHSWEWSIRPLQAGAFRSLLVARNHWLNLRQQLAP